MELKPKHYIKDEKGKIVLADENKIHISEAITLVNFDTITSYIEECKIRYEGNYSEMDFYLHKADFIEHCIKSKSK